MERVYSYEHFYVLKILAPLVQTKQLYSRLVRWTNNENCLKNVGCSLHNKFFPYKINKNKIYVSKLFFGIKYLINLLQNTYHCLLWYKELVTLCCIFSKNQYKKFIILFGPSHVKLAGYFARRNCSVLIHFIITDLGLSR